MPDRRDFLNVFAMQIKGEDLGASASDLALCIQSLVNEGRPAISTNPSNIDDIDTLPLLAAMDASIREELSLDVPAFSPAAALWGARLFHQLCLFVVCRDIPEDQIKQTCEVACPEQRGPQTDWSVDLTLHHLPNLFQLARHLSNGDPLIAQMKQIAVTWPFSSVGIAGLENLRLDSFVNHPALRRVYGDRILAAGDASRLGEAVVNDLLRADLGFHRELSSTIAAKLFETIHDTR